MSVKDTRKPGYSRLTKFAEELRGKSITVGVHEAEGGAVDGELTVAALAEIHEFGLGVPARPWLRGWFDAKEDRFPAAIQAELAQSFKAGESAEVALQRLAVTFQADIQDRIASGYGYPENALETVLRKGSSTPLVDTGVLRASILARVESK